MPYFAGARLQQGYGLGNLFRSIAKSVLPLVKKGAKTLGKQVLQSDVDFASDVLQGRQTSCHRPSQSSRYESLASSPTKAKGGTEKSTKEETQETSRYFANIAIDLSTAE